MYKIRLMNSVLPGLDEYVKEIEDIWTTHWTTNMGVKHRKLEAELREYLDVSEITLFANGHMALEAAIEAMNFPEGREIITTPFTFASTTHAIIRKKLVPIFCDINKDNYTIDVNCIENLITDKTVAILPVHVYGNVCDIEAIEKIAQKYGLKVIYDAAHAFGVKYKNRSIANYGDVAMFSFHATKVFNTIEGGALCYNDKNLKNRFDEIKNFGYLQGDVDYPGGNAKMNEFQAAMGLCNLRHIEDEITKRKRLADIYISRFSGIEGIKLCEYSPHVEHNYSYMPVVFDGYKCSRDAIQKMLLREGIESRTYFYPLTSEYSYFSKSFLGSHIQTPCAKRISENILTLPLFGDLEPENVHRICDIILSV